MDRTAVFRQHGKSINSIGVAHAPLRERGPDAESVTARLARTTSEPNLWEVDEQAGGENRVDACLDDQSRHAQEQKRCIGLSRVCGGVGPAIHPRHAGVERGGRHQLQPRSAGARDPERNAGGVRA